MASIQTRTRADGSVAFRVMFRIDGKLVGETFDSIEGAEEFRGWVEKFGGREARALRLARSGEGPVVPTVAEWCREHVRRLSGITAGTRARYESIIERTIAPAALGALPVDVVNRGHVAGWIREQESAGLAGKTILNRHGLLYAAMASAAAEGLRSGPNPCERSGIRRSERKAAPVFLTHGEFALLLGHMPERWRPLTVVLAGTGLRFGEATALRVHDVHLDDDPPRLHVERAWQYVNGRASELGPPKTRKGRRTVSLSPNVVAVLRPLVDGRDPTAFVFTTAGGRPVRNVDYREDGWLPALRRATASRRPDGSPIPPEERLTKRPRIHDLRHTHASWLIADNVPLTVIQHRLGHESIKTTSDTYGHLAPDAQARAAAAIEVALAQALPALAS